MSAQEKKIDTGGGQSLGQSPFSALDGLSLPKGPSAPSKASSPTSEPKNAPTKNRGRVDILREKMGRGGKTVTVAANFMGIGLSEKELLAKKIQRACGVGGTVKDGRIEIQGDRREDVARILTEAGFKPVFA